MDFSVSEEQHSLREGLIRFARKELNNGVAERDRDRSFPRDLWSKCGQMGLQGLPVPQSYGGSGLDSLSTAMALEALGYGCEDGGLVFAICAHLLACVVPIWKHGTEQQRRRYLPGLCDGTLIGGGAMTEAGSGSDVFSLATRATPDGEGFRLNGTKLFVSNGPVADVVILYAMTDPQKGYHGGITAFVVERGGRGFGTGQTFEKMGLRTAPLGELVLDDVHVPQEAVLGGVGGGANLFLQAMDWERVCLFAGHVGVMDRLLEKSIEYARARTLSGKPIGKFQAVSHRIADMKVQLEAARLLVYAAAWRLDRVKNVSLDAAMAKLFVSESLVKAALDAVQLHGGAGYMVESGLERVLRDSVASTIYSGTSEVQRNIIARWLGL